MATFGHFQAILYIAARGVFQKSDWVLLFICLKPCDELPLCFKVNPNPLSWLSRPSTTHLWSSLCPLLRPPHPYLCPPDINHSFRASDATLFPPSETCSLCSHRSLALECSTLSLCVTVSCSSFRSQLKCHPLYRALVNCPPGYPSSLLHCLPHSTPILKKDF